MPSNTRSSGSPRRACRSSTPGRGLLLLLTLASACGDDAPADDSFAPYEELAAESCAARFACACEEHYYRDQEECERVTRADFAAIVASVEEAGLTVDWECFVRREFPLAIGCEAYGAPDSESPCLSAFGDDAANEPCVYYWGFASCQRGLRCVETVDGHRCVDREAPFEGSYCEYRSDCGDTMTCEASRCTPLPKIGEPCAARYDCVRSAYCKDEVCVPYAAAGEPCFTSTTCIPGTFCRADGVCAEPGEVGALCEFEADCAGELVCREERCIEPPDVGEPCPEHRCRPGGSCDRDTMICVAGEPLACWIP